MNLKATMCEKGTENINLSYSERPACFDILVLRNILTWKEEKNIVMQHLVNL